ncbi:hypothetical protein DA096_19635 [Vibrio rotiferianus]|nr:hypothetical protein DA095_07575 [Vibrio rotiferianus]TMX54958.1 hypothetical protein DA093_08665 [Vibrio rotiferianus]TMX60621.1 hypothetical protein DA096_19635 [Vibrio rotiferianus]
MQTLYLGIWSKYKPNKMFKADSQRLPFSVLMLASVFTVVWLSKVERCSLLNMALGKWRKNGITANRYYRVSPCWRHL